VYGVSKAALKELSLPIPPQDEQTAIAEILSDMDAEIEALENKLAKARQIKQGMMQELLTGRIRLIAREKNGDTASSC
jgi:type I restriction enzyme S subunit